MSTRSPVRFSQLAASLTVLVALGGCVMPTTGPGGGYVSRPTYAEGDWGDTQGISTSQLRNGLLTTIDNSNGATLARGSYSYIDTQNISLDYVSIGKATRVKANCLLVSPSEMNCTRADGVQFKLVRRSSIYG